MTSKTHAAVLFISSMFAAASCVAQESLAGPTVVPCELHQCIVNPTVPDTVVFGGEIVLTDREDMYERLDRELTSMAYTHGNTLLLIKRANKYFPQLTAILDQCGVPRDLVYLACVESSLNTRAYSPAKAAGLWQFIPSTARQYGLEVNDWVDQRYDIELETRAACRYLKKSHAMFGNWETAAASYNAGSGKIQGELDAQGAATAGDLWLVDETSRYYFRILATKLILENPGAYGFALESDQLYYPATYDAVEVTGPVDDWAGWALEHGVTYAQLREANQWIRAKSLPNRDGKTYRVLVPRAHSLSRSRQERPVFNPQWITDYEKD